MTIRILIGLLAWAILLCEAITVDNRLTDEDKPEQASENKTTDRYTEETDQIRVVLTDTDGLSYYHSLVTVSVPGKIITLDPKSPQLKEGSYTIDGGEEGFAILSMERGYGKPHYQGTLTVYPEQEGLVLVNTLPLEEYLRSVLPSEMPAGYEKEALKAQAVCARTYAEKQIQMQRMKKYHADVDDSVACQVYGNLPAQDRTDEAVEETKGQVLEYEGDLIEAYYFSTSSGQTSTNEIWSGEDPLPYLKSVACPYDQQEAWSAWEVDIPWDVLEDQLAKYLAWEGDLHLEEIAVTAESESSAVTELTVTIRREEKNGETVRETPGSTEAGTGSAAGAKAAEMITVSGEYDVRKVLAPSACSIARKNSDPVQGTSLLPSACFSIETEPGVQVTLHGKGYGHGVGMSQTAANEMAKLGFSCEEILYYFFQGVEIKTDRTDSGSLATADKVW